MFSLLLNVCALPEGFVIYSDTKCEKCQRVMQDMTRINTITVPVVAKDEPEIELPDLILSHSRRGIGDPVQRVGEVVRRTLYNSITRPNKQQTAVCKEAGRKLRKIADNFRPQTPVLRALCRLRRGRKNWFFCLMSVGASGYLLIRVLQ